MKIVCAINLLLVLLTGSRVMAQTTFVIDQVPAHYTPLLEYIYMAPSINGWNPGDVNYKFSKHSDGKYYLTFKPTVDTLFHFKFTRGDWARVEVNAAGADITNRSFSYGSDTMHFTIEQWHDMLVGTNTATGNVNILITNFAMPQLSTTRRLWIYLPADYYTSGLNYPVLYMQDGQNVFDALYSFAGEWDVDESLNAATPVRDCIVIAIDNGPNRIAEYTPFVDPSYGGGSGDAYMAFMVNTLKPFIDSTFRTLPQPEHTGILGSSLGGLISLYGGLKFQDVYGRVGAFSPSIWFDNYQIDTYIKGVTNTGNQKIYFTAGTAESSSDDVVTDVSGAVSALEGIGYLSNQLNTYVFQGGQHSEYYWAQEFPAAYQWLNLWGTSLGVNNAVKVLNWTVTNYNGSLVTVRLNNAPAENYTLMVSDELGRVMFSHKMDGGNSSYSLRASNFVNRIYSFTMVSEQRTDTKRIAIMR